MSAAGTTTNPLTAFATKVEAWAESVKADIIAVADKFLPAVENDLEIAFDDLAEIAGQAVLAQATATLSGQEKASTAVTNVIQTVEASGKTVAVATAQTAVQQAYIAVQSVAVANQPQT